MSRELIVLVTLLGYGVTLLGIGAWASRRTSSNEDFFIGSRRLGPIVASISASASSSSAWTLLGVSGAAYGWGLSALWLFPATLLGFVFNWFWLAPRLMPLAHESGAVTLPEIIAGGAEPEARTLILRSTALVIFASFLFYVASQFQAAGGAFAETFGINRATAILIGGGVVMLYTYAGGFWAVSVTDTLQGLLMAGTAIVLPIGAIVSIGGIGEFAEHLVYLSRLGGDAGSIVQYAGPAAIGFVIGTLGIGMGYPGQPHVVNRLMALRDAAALRSGRVIAIVWAVIIYSGMITLGWSGRALVDTMANGEQIFFAVANQVFAPVAAGVMIAAVLSAIMSTADSQLLVVASSVSHDWFGGEGAASSARLRTSRRVVITLSLLSMMVAIYAPATIFERVLFAWHALGSAFGPVLILQLLGMRIRARWILTAIWVGFGLTVVIHWFPSAPGDWIERMVPFVASLIVAWAGRGSVRPS